MTTVLVFKTSISKKNHIKKVKPLLNHLIAKKVIGILTWRIATTSSELKAKPLKVTSFVML